MAPEHLWAGMGGCSGLCYLDPWIPVARWVSQGLHPDPRGPWRPLSHVQTCSTTDAYARDGRAECWPH